LLANRNRILRPAKALVSGLAMVFLLFASTLAVSPSLHHFFHHDSGSDTHSCLVTLLANGQVVSADGFVAVAFFVPAMLFLASPEAPSPSPERDLRLPAGRAPPLV
jgi:hypothetical protein